MFSFKMESTGSANRTKVDFPVDLAVENVTLRSIERNERILGIDFNFQRVDGDTIAWLTGSILPPKKEWYTESKQVGDKVITADEQFNSAVNSFMGYVRHILSAAGVPADALNDVTGDTLEALVDNLISTALPLINTKATFYLKTVKDKNGYTRIPQFRGTGVVQASDLGYPSKFAYSTYERDILDTLGVEGVTDSTSSGTEKKGSGLDF